MLRFTRPYIRYEVSGSSMLPALRPGDWVIAERHFGCLPLPGIGEIVLARDPREDRRVLIKRVARRDGDEGLWLLGDNAAASTDSRTLGAFPPEMLLGRVRLRYWPPPLGRVHRIVK
jgi:nickel-type superoxide dismutase maturation protease